MNCSPSNIKCVTGKEHYAWLHGIPRISDNTRNKIKEYAEMGMTIIQIAKVLDKPEELINNVLGE